MFDLEQMEMRWVQLRVVRLDLIVVLQRFKLREGDVPAKENSVGEFSSDVSCVTGVPKYVIEHIRRSVDDYLEGRADVH